jgi:hypothetical protein
MKKNSDKKEKTVVTLTGVKLHRLWFPPCCVDNRRKKCRPVREF